MAIFKPLKGTSSRIATSITPLHEGWMYLTVDDKKLYADVVNASGTLERMCLNPGATIVNTTLKASGWSGGQQTLSVDGLTANSNGVIGMAQTITDSQEKALKSAEVRISGQAAGAVTLTASGVVPTVDIPVTVILFS